MVVGIAGVVVGANVFVGSGVGSGVSVGLGVAVGASGVAVGSGVFVGSAVGSFVKVALRVAVGSGDSVGVGDSVSVGDACVFSIGGASGLGVMVSVETTGRGVVIAVYVPHSRGFQANSTPRASTRITSTPAKIGTARSL